MNVQINRDFFRSLFYFNGEENSALQSALEDKLLYDNNVTTWYDKIHFFLPFSIADKTKHGIKQTNIRKHWFDNNFFTHWIILLG